MSVSSGERTETQEEFDRRMAINAKMRFHRSLASYYASPVLIVCCDFHFWLGLSGFASFIHSFIHSFIIFHHIRFSLPTCCVGKSEGPTPQFLGFVSRIEGDIRINIYQDLVCFL